MQSKIIRAFVLSAGVILTLTGFAKLIGATGDARILDLRDPLLALSFRSLFGIVGALEMIVGLGCILGRRTGPQIALIAWLSVNFLAYRLALEWSGVQKPCPCLGNLTEALHLSPETADAIMKGVLAYLLAGSAASSIWWWKQKSHAAPAAAIAR